MDDYDADRQRVAAALHGLLRWEMIAAAKFVRLWKVGEVDDAAEHLRIVRDARVGLAAVVYAVRMRLAAGSPQLERAASLEANEHARLLAQPYTLAMRDVPAQPGPRTFHDPTPIDLDE